MQTTQRVYSRTAQIFDVMSETGRSISFCNVMNNTRPVADVGFRVISVADAPGITKIHHI